MQFTGSRAANNTSRIPTTISFNNNVSFKPNYNIYKTVLNTPAPAPMGAVSDPNKTTEIEPVQKMKWGKPTWYMLHTLSEKVSEAKFSEIRVGFLNLIYTICTNLPCPNCSAHAKTHLDNINFNNIQTKSQLKHILYDFHNVVNKKKGYATFPFSELDSTYSKAITENIIRHFFIHYDVKNKSIRMISDDIFRNRIIQNLKAWLQMHISFFMP
jgi:hypothetical protein